MKQYTIANHCYVSLRTPATKKNNASYICHLGNDLIITKYTTPNSTRRGFVMVKRLYMYIAAGIINFLDHWGIYAIVSHWLIFMLWWSIDNALTAPGMIRWPIVGCSFTFLYNYISLFTIEVHTEVVDDLQKTSEITAFKKVFFSSTNETFCDWRTIVNNKGLVKRIRRNIHQVGCL